MPNVLTAYAKGMLGEDAACRLLIQKGYAPLQQRYRSDHGEIDLIMLDGEMLGFIEVKTRESLSAQAAQYAVTPGKRKRMMHTARYYLAEHPEHAQRVMRFDIVTVAKDGTMHIPNAFDGSAW